MAKESCLALAATQPGGNTVDFVAQVLGLNFHNRTCQITAS
jgi:hypothetical protein